MQKAVQILCAAFTYYGTLPVLLGILALTSISGGLAQQGFEIPVTVTDGVESQTEYFGVLPNGNFCIVGSDSINGHSEYFLPPVPPEGVFDTRLVWPRSGSNLACFDQGSWFDYRSYVSSAQRDTFRVRSQRGPVGVSLIASWPAGLSTYFTQLTFRYFNGTNFVIVDMLTNTTVDFTDADPPPATFNIFAQLAPLGVQPIPGVPEEFALSQNYPNPFNPSTSMEFAIPTAAQTEISVYNILGQKIATLASELFTAGAYIATWDGKNSTGGDVPSGVYFVRMSAKVSGESGNDASFSAVRKLVLMR